MLEVPDQIIVERLTSRRLCKNCGTVYNIRFLKPKVEGKCDKCGGELYQRADDNETVIRNRLQVYKTQTEPVVEYYKKTAIPFIVNVTTSIDQPPEPMVEHMMAELKKLKLA
jgi:adenylate kinase